MRYLWPVNLNLWNNIWWSVQVLNLFIMQFSPIFRHFLLLDPDILLSTLFAQLFTSPSFRDHVSHPYKTTCKILIFHILNLNFLTEVGKTNIIIWTKQLFIEFNLFLIFSWMKFSFVIEFPYIRN
jgi:hypothetical protein